MSFFVSAHGRPGMGSTLGIEEVYICILGTYPSQNKAAHDPHSAAGGTPASADEGPLFGEREKKYLHEVLLLLLLLDWG